MFKGDFILLEKHFNSLVNNSIFFKMQLEFYPKLN